VSQRRSCVTIGAMANLIWSIIAVVGGLLVVVVVAYFIATGRTDRADDEAARDYFAEHGHWPDERPSP
jgi:hypothetical protein